MYVASLELSRTLYKLSGWDYKSQYVHATDNYSDGRAKHLLTRDMLGSNPFDSNMKYVFVAPAYTAGFLLRKLPLSTHLTHMDKWYCNVSSPKPLSAEADTPENAACLLLIELIKQEVIKP